MFEKINIIIRFLCDFYAIFIQKTIKMRTFAPRKAVLSKKVIFLL